MNESVEQENPSCPYRLGIQQRVLPAYRVPFFDLLAKSFLGGVSVFAGQPIAEESVKTSRTLNFAKYREAGNAHLFTVDSPLYLCWQRGIIDWLEEWQPDVLIVDTNPRLPSTRSAVQWMHVRKRPVIGWGLGAPLYSKKNPVDKTLSFFKERYRLGLIHSLDAIMAYSKRGAGEYRRLGFPADRIFIAHNAVTSRSDASMPERNLQQGEKPTVLFVGRLQSRKRIDLLLRACAALPDELQPHLVIVGDGPARSGLEDMSEGIYPQAEFTGATHGERLADHFAKADLFVLPGTGGLAVQQAMSYGLPVIVASGDGTQEDIVRPENGWLISPDDLDETITHLKIALSDIEKLRMLGKASYKIVESEINLEEMVRCFTLVARRVVKNLR